MKLVRNFLLSIFWLIPFMAFSQTVIDDMEFEINTEDSVPTCTLARYLGNAADVIVPESVFLYEGTHKVTKIGSLAFKGNENIQTVILPSGLTSIQGAAFRECSNLVKINFPENLETIESLAFYKCSISSVKFPNSLKSIGEKAFYNNPISKVTIPNNVQSIGEEAFYQRNADLRVIVIEDGIKNLTLATGAFSQREGVRKYISIGRNIISNELIHCPNNLRIGQNVSDMSFMQFDTDLEQIVSEAVLPPNLGTFKSDLYTKTKLILHSSLKSEYENNSQWCFFKNVITSEIPFENYSISISPKELIVNAHNRFYIDTVA